MQLAFYQIVIIFIAFLFITDRAIKFTKQEHRQSFLKFIIMICIWSSVLLLILFPNLAHTISLSLGMGENLNTMIFIGFIIVFGIIYKLLNIIERMEKEITSIVRRDALKEITKNHDKKKK